MSRTDSHQSDSPQTHTHQIDSHQHFWRYTHAEYDWIDDTMAAIRRDFLPHDLQRELTASGFSGSVAVQARQSLEETHWLLQLSRDHPDVVKGVVGWVPLRDPAITGTLDKLAGEKSLKGVRHVVQGEPDPQFLLRADFNRGVAALLPHGLVYDILIVERQLSVAAAFVDRHPKQVFVLDHIAKPRIAAGEREPWASHLRELAKRSNVCCKISGMVTEANYHAWRPEQLTPYLDVVLEAFGPDRLLFGSDWPVCLVATTYGTWSSLVKQYIGRLGAAEQRAILGGTAARAYKLPNL